jgi:electron transfer flavoprotein alpha/beta subunit
MRVLLPVTGAFHGRLRVRRSLGTLDTEGLGRVLSEPSIRAISLAKQLQGEGAEIVAVHVDKGAGEDVLREALAHGVDQGILVEGAADENSDASVRAATIADVYRQHGRFDAVIGPSRSEFGGFSGTLAAVAGRLDLPCVVGVNSIRSIDSGFRIGYASIFGEYELDIPSPSVIMAGEVLPSYPTSWGIRAAYHDRGVLRVQADQYTVGQALTKRVRIEAAKKDSGSLEQVDGATLARRLRSRALLPEADA